MASPLPYPVVDDKDLDDAALWAVIDSAAASYSSNKFCKTLAIKLPNFQSQSPISNPSPPPSKLQKTNCSDSDSKVYAEDSWPFRPPRKIPRTCSSDVNDTSPLVVYRNVQRSPTTPGYFSPEAYLSPGIKRFSSPESSPRSEEEKSGTHSLSGRFPSVSLFKEYQNAAMAVNFLSLIFMDSY